MLVLVGRLELGVVVFGYLSLMIVAFAGEGVSVVLGDVILSLLSCRKVAYFSINYHSFS